MRLFVVDTNTFIHAMRDAEMRTELPAWQRLMAPRLYQHAVVISELLVGAPNSEAWQRWHERWVLPAERVRRVLVPAYRTWLRASRIISDLCHLGHISAGGTEPGFFERQTMDGVGIESEWEDAAAPTGLGWRRGWSVATTRVTS